MTAKIKLLRSVVAGHVPATLESGQVAINEADDRLFWRHSDGTIKSIDMTLALMATQAWVTTQIGDLIASAPGALNTLDELAAALGDDANFAATVTAALGNRVRYDAAQTLDAGQKTQARNNIGAGTSSFDGVYASLTGKPTLFDGAYASLTGKPTLGSAAALDVGTAANKVVQLDATARLPAVDGSQLTGINAVPKDLGAAGAIGAIVFAGSTSATNNGATVAGSTIKLITISYSGTMDVGYTGAIFSGTWRNISGVNLAAMGGYGVWGGMFQRIA
jgi:hypothetical protein